MKKLIFVIIVLIGIMSTQLIYAKESCGVATAQHIRQYAWFIKCKSGRQFTCDAMGGEDGISWKCECDSGDCKGEKYYSDINEAAQTSCCSAENRITVSKEGAVTTEEKVKSVEKKSTTVKETAKEKAERDAVIAKTNVEWDTVNLPKMVDFFFKTLDEAATQGGGLAGSKGADYMMIKIIAETHEKGGKGGAEAINLVKSEFVLYNLFELHINDEISCAVTVEEAKELKDMKDVAYMSGGAWATNGIRKMLDFTDDQGNPAGLKRMKMLFKHVFESQPRIKEIYMKNPHRKHCH